MNKNTINTALHTSGKDVQDKPIALWVYIAIGCIIRIDLRVYIAIGCILRNALWVYIAIGCIMLLPGVMVLWVYIPIGCIKRNALWERHTCCRRSLLYCGYILRHTLWLFPEITTTATLASVCETLQPLFCTLVPKYFTDLLNKRGSNMGSSEAVIRYRVISVGIRSDVKEVRVKQ